MVITVQLFNWKDCRVGVSVLEIEDIDIIPDIVEYKGKYYKLFQADAMVIFKYKEIVVTKITEVIEG
jgi:hypothetical protein